jgi:16S rRNA (guanine527-N7)-methyltransferase
MRGNPLNLGAAERAVLIGEAAALGVTLDGDATHRFCELARLLGVWNARINLLSCGSARELVERHFADSLAVAPLLGGAVTTVDLGSGAGFPGLPLAIAYPSKRFTLVESRRRRASFLREVARALDLANVKVAERRAEKGPGSISQGPVEAAVCRAVWSDETAVAVAAPWLVPAGRFFWMRGVSAAKPIARGAPRVGEMLFERQVGYRIGGRERTVEIFCRR